MSWDSYLDNLVGHSKDANGAAHVDKCCIIGLDGGASWTTSASPYALTVSIIICATSACVIVSY